MTFSAEQAERYSRHFVLREIGVEGQERLLYKSIPIDVCLVRGSYAD